MIAENIHNIIDKLAEKTKAGQATWNPSSGANGFRLSLHTGVISIDKWSNDRDDSAIDFKIFNDRGDIIEFLQVSQHENRPDYDFFDSFYSIIRRKYLKVDETLKGLLDELNANKPLGKPDDPSKDHIDDLPF